jgi:hypothetical protein
MSDKPPLFDFNDYPGLSNPNWTQIPDEVLDFMLPALSGAEVKVLLYILRRTYGFKRDADRITLTQLCSGIRRHDGSHLDYGTGLSRRAVIEAVKGLEEKGVVDVVRGLTDEGVADVNVYRIRQASDGVVQKSNYGSYFSAPGVVQKSNPQETVVRKTVVQEKEQQQQGLDVPNAAPSSEVQAQPGTDVVVAHLELTHQTTTVPPPPAPSQQAILPRLTALGVAQATARKLLQTHDGATIYRWIVYVEHKLATGWMPRESPGAWIVTAIKSGDWVIPDWFQTPEEEAVLAVERTKAFETERRQREEEAERESQKARAERKAMEVALGVGERASELWEQVRALLEARRESSIALHSAFLLPLNGRIATIATPVQFFAQVIERRADIIRRAIEEVSGQQIERLEVRLAGPLPTER